MRDLLKQAPPTRFEDIIALVALYRPGPMALIPDYIARKSGRERVPMPDPRLEPILEPTYGVMVYQEQVMQIAQVIGGYSLGGADLLRRAMGKKKPEEMATHRTIFVEGARQEQGAGGPRDAALQRHGKVRRLRLQPLARRRLRAHRLPDRVVQGPSSRRVHGSQPFAGHGRHRQGAPLPRRRDRAGVEDAAAGRERVELPLRTGGREADPLRLGRRQGHRPVGDRGRDGGPRRGRAVPRPLRFLPARGQARRQQARGGGAGARGRVRRHRAAPRGIAGVGGHGARGRGAGRGQRRAGIAVRRGRSGTLRWA